MADTTIRIRNGSQVLSYNLWSFGKNSVIIGRNPDSDIVINNPRVSGHHGCFYLQNGVWCYQDMQSTNGSSINGRPVSTTQLGNGTVLVMDRNGASEAPVIQVAIGAASQGSYGAGGYGTTGAAGAYGAAGARQGSYGSAGSGQGAYGSGGSGARPTSFGAAWAGESGNSSGASNGYQGRPYAPKASSGASKPSAPPPKKKSNAPLIATLASLGGILLVVVLLFAFGVFGGSKDTDRPKGSSSEVSTDTGWIKEPTTRTTEKWTEQPTTEEPTTGSDEPKELESEVIYQQASQSTVEVQATNGGYGSIGTGFFDDEKGTVITNYHVIDGMTAGYILTVDEKQYDITAVLGYDPDMDIAILKTEISSSIPLKRRTGKVVTGEKVYALGSSQGYDGTFTEGIVSTAERNEGGHVYIQHSAPITNGNSGGPLLDKYGQVVGINNWMRTDGQNLNFAIPIDQVDLVPRGSTQSMADVYTKEYGGTGSSGSDIEIMKNGSTVTLGSSGGKSLTVDVPAESMTTSNGEAKVVTYMHGRNGVVISGGVESNPYGGSIEDNSETIIEYMTKALDEMSQQYGVEFSEIETEVLMINGTYWTVYTTYGMVSSGDLAGYLMDFSFYICEKDGVYAMASIVTMVIDTDYDEWEYIYEAEQGAISSLKFK